MLCRTSVLSQVPWFRSSFLGACCLLIFAGCSGDGLNRQAITGTFTVDGKPLPNGSISFEPLVAGGIGSGAVISDGKFSISSADGLPPGKYLVRASGDDGTSFGVGQGKMPGDEIMPPKKALVPGNWKEEVEVKKGGNNAFEFTISSSVKAAKK